MVPRWGDAMLTICAYCKRITEKGVAVSLPLSDKTLAYMRKIRDDISDGICLDCAKVEREKLAQYRKEK